MSVFLSSAYIHSELHLLRASSVLYTDPMNLQYFTLYQNPDIIRKKNYSLISLGVKDTVKKKLGEWKPVMLEKIIYQSPEKFLSCKQYSI